MTIRRAVFDRHVLALGEADLAQTLPERIHQRQRLRRALVKETYHRGWVAARVRRAATRPPRRRAA